MKKWRVYWAEHHEVEVEADNEDEAWEKATSMNHNETYGENYEHLSDVEEVNE